MSVTASNEKEGACAFTRLDGQHAYSLEVSVHTSANTPCRAGGTKLLGIGNDAVLCRTERPPSESVQTVSSRVRDLYFTVRLTVRGSKPAAMSIDAQREAVTKAAEQVAGNLY